MKYFFRKRLGQGMPEYTVVLALIVVMVLAVLGKQGILETALVGFFASIGNI